MFAPIIKGVLVENYHLESANGICLQLLPVCSEYRNYPHQDGYNGHGQPVVEPPIKVTTVALERLVQHWLSVPTDCCWSAMTTTFSTV